jgi:hypothetical protein
MGRIQGTTALGVANTGHASRLKEAAHTGREWLHNKHDVAAIVLSFGAILGELAELPAFVRVLFLCLLIVLVLAILASWLFVSTRTLRLSRRWQVLAWTHYRGLLGEMMARSVNTLGRAELDFVTYCGVEYARKLQNNALVEFKYNRFATGSLDILICDIENMFDLVHVPPSFAGITGSIVPLGELTKERRTQKQLKHFLTGDSESRAEETCPIPDLFTSELRPAEDTLGLPLLWGENGITLKLSTYLKKNLRDQGIDVDNLKSFDMGWLFDPTHPIRLLAECGLLRVIALDWYLPTMLLISWWRFGALFSILDESQFEVLVQDLDRLTPIMDCRSRPLAEDPLDLVECVNSQDPEESFLVIGGGDWLARPQGNETANIASLPTTQGWLVWCECLVFLTTSGEADQRRAMGWEKDADGILRYILRRYEDFRHGIAFNARSPQEAATLRSRDGSTDPRRQLRRLPPRTGPYVRRKQWEEAWTQWKGALSARTTL